MRHMFQFTLPRGERLIWRQFLEGDQRVSIHAPAGGATADSAAPAADVSFQFTLPRGERQQVARV